MGGMDKGQIAISDLWVGEGMENKKEMEKGRDGGGGV